MKRILALAVLLAVLAAGGFFAWRAYQENLAEEAAENPVTELDLSGADTVDVRMLCNMTQLQLLDLRDTALTVAEYEKLQAALPNCRILWQVPVQGQYLELDTLELEITALTREEMESLKYLTQLQHIRAENCTDLDMLLSLQERYPQLQVDYLVSIGGKTVAGNTENLSGVSGDIREIQEALRYLPKLKKLSLAIAEPDNEAVYGLIQAYPNVSVRWNVQICGKRFASTVRELELSGIQVENVSQVEDALKYFPDLERVVMCECGISSQEMDAMWKRNPQIRFVWSVKIANRYVRTDVTTFMPYQYGIASLRNRDAKEMKYLVDVMCMDLGHMGITDLSFLQYMPDMEYLIIADCGIRDISCLEGLTKLKYLEAFQNEIRDISVLATCTSLRDLNVCYNNIRDFSPLYGLEKLEHLWIMDNYVTNETRDILEETFPEATIMYHTYSSTGNGWREIPGYYEQRDLLGMWYMTG